MDYAIIGDIHGYAGKLKELLTALGFVLREGAWRNPDCHAVFVGDLIDRGPEQLEVVNIVRGMVEAGSASACLGNHDFNAIGWATEIPNRPGRYHRIRGSKNFTQHRVFLEAVGGDSPLHHDVVAWFASLPLWLEFEGFRAVHACWHPAMQQALAPYLDARNVMTSEGVQEIFRPGSIAYEAAEIVLKGPEVSLPPGVVYTDKEGHARRATRVSWWNPDADTFRKAALVDEETAKQLPDEPLPDRARVIYNCEKPVFFGHYWMTGEPRILTPDMACLDFSVAKGGYLTAYRWTGEPKLDNSHFVSIAPDQIVEHAPTLAL